MKLYHYKDGRIRNHFLTSVAHDWNAFNYSDVYFWCDDEWAITDQKEYTFSSEEIFVEVLWGEVDGDDWVGYY